MPAGRPLKYKTVEELEKGIEKYFKKEKVHPTINGLALFLGFYDKSSMKTYNDRPEFSPALKSAITRIESIHEKRLFENSCTGSIFWLKNRGWNAEETTKQEIEQKGHDLSKLTAEQLTQLASILGASKSGDSES